MSDTADHLTSEETQDIPGYDVSLSPPSYSNQEQQPPPLDAMLAMYPPSKLETTCTLPPPVVTGYESSCDINPVAPSVMTSVGVSSSFDDNSVRRGFVRKVYSILTLQLLFTFSVVCVFTFSSTVKQAVHANFWVYISSIIIFVVVAIGLSCFRSFSRRHPWNIVGLVLVTMSLSYMVGTIASYHDTTSVVISMGSTLAITVTIIVFSMQTRFDFTVCYGILLILAVDLLMFGIFCTFLYSYIGEVAYGCLGALLYSLFLMVDCQLLMGMMSYRLHPEEYINAALIIYLDIAIIFLYLLGRK